VLNVEMNASKLHTKEIPFLGILRQYRKDFVKFLLLENKCCGWRHRHEKVPLTDVRYILRSTEDVSYA